MPHSRREFIARAACALGGAGLGSALDGLGLLSARAQDGGASDYRALVCVFLFGGNDGDNMVIPHEDAGSDFNYSMYDAVRGGAAGLAIPKSQLEPLTVTPPSVGRRFAFHPSLPELKAFFDAGCLAVVCNTGPLVEPLTRAAYRSGSGRAPAQLFSHSHQVALWQTSNADAYARTGWGGRLADRVSPLNGASTFPQAVTIAGTSVFLTGASTQQLAIVDAGNALAVALTLDMSGEFSQFRSRREAFEAVQVSELGPTLVRADSEIRRKALQSSAVLSRVPFKHYNTVFPSSPIARQLLQVGRLIHERKNLGVKRQIFFTLMGGFDNHSNQRGAGGQDGLLRQLSQALKAFYDLLAEMSPSVGSDVTKEVTTFTLSDFGRTFQPSGGGAGVGSDHGWGGHHLVMGGSVRGGDFYGKYPTLLLGGPDDADDRGRWIPTTAVEQYAATLATWYGLPASELPSVFPLVNNFPSANMGFML